MHSADGEAGFSFPGAGGVDRALRSDPPQKGSIDGTPKILPRLTPGASQVTQTQKSAAVAVFSGCVPAPHVVAISVAVQQIAIRSAKYEAHACPFSHGWQCGPPRGVAKADVLDACALKNHPCPSRGGCSGAFITCMKHSPSRIKVSYRSPAHLQSTSGPPNSHAVTELEHRLRRQLRAAVRLRHVRPPRGNAVRLCHHDPRQGGRHHQTTPQKERDDHIVAHGGVHHPFGVLEEGAVHPVVARVQQEARVARARGLGRHVLREKPGHQHQGVPVHHRVVGLPGLHQQVVGLGAPQGVDLRSRCSPLPSRCIITEQKHLKIIA